MEENNGIKKKNTGMWIIIIILVMVIIGLLAYIYYLKGNESANNAEKLASNSSNVDSSELDTDNKDNTDNEVKENGNNADDKVELPQLDGNFYKISKFLKERREIGEVKNYKDFEYDIDGDGKTDKITLKHKAGEDETNDENSYMVEYNGQTIYDNWWGFGEVGIVDLDDTDDQLEIWVYDDGPSDDPVYSFYRKVGDKIVELGGFSVDMGFVMDGKGKVLACDRSMPRVSPLVYDSYWTIDNNKLVKNKLDFTNNPDYEYSVEGFGDAENIGYFTTDLENIEKFEKGLENSSTDSYSYYPEHKEEFKIEELKKGEKFKIKGFVPIKKDYGVYDLEVVLPDGREGYLMHPYGRVSFYD